MGNATILDGAHLDHATEACGFAIRYHYPIRKAALRPWKIGSNARIALCRTGRPMTFAQMGAQFVQEKSLNERSMAAMLVPLSFGSQAHARHAGSRNGPDGQSAWKACSLEIDPSWSRP